MLSKSEIESVKTNVKIKDYVNDFIIKEMPMYYNDYTVDLDNKPYIKCPVHGEDTPSFRVYEDTNTFYCFGCGAGGDVIKLHQLFISSVVNTNVSFDEAVRFLKNKFINKNTADKKIKPKKDIENLGKDLLKLSKLYNEIEETLKIDNSLSDESKLRIYNSIDIALAFVELKKISAVEAIQYIKDSLDKELGGSNDL